MTYIHLIVEGIGWLSIAGIIGFLLLILWHEANATQNHPEVK